MNCCIKRIIEFTQPMAYHDVLIYNENNFEYSKLCQYSWSDDGVCWTSFCDKNKFIQICSNMQSDFYLKILIADSLSRVLLDNEIYTCYTISFYNECVFDIDLCSQTLFNPYANTDCAIMLQQQMSDSIICMFGYEAYYFRVEPDVTSADYTFKEYALHNVTSVKQIKIMAQDGELPSSKMRFSEWDWTFENEWDVEISKRHFARAFGDDAIPKQRDFVYVPKLKLLFEVNSSYTDNATAFMYQAPTWHIVLVKWNEKTNVEQAQFAPMIDSFLTSTYEEAFFPIEQQECERESGTTQTQMPQYIGNTLYNVSMSDAIRKMMSVDKLTIIDEQLNHQSLCVSMNRYHFTSRDAFVDYAKPFCGDEMTLLMCLQNNECEDGEYELFRIANVCATFKCKTMKTTRDMKTIRRITFNDENIEIDDNADNIILYIAYSRKLMTVNMCIINHVIDEKIPLIQRRAEMYQFDFANARVNTSLFNDELIVNGPANVRLCASPLDVRYFKLFDTYMPIDAIRAEACKYVTNNEHCVINDVARKIDDNVGFSVR